MKPILGLTSSLFGALVKAGLRQLAGQLATHERYLILDIPKRGSRMDINISNGFKRKIDW